MRHRTSTRSSLIATGGGHLRRRLTFATSISVFLVVALAGSAAAAVSWGSPKVTSDTHTFNYGLNLASTKSGSTTWLHEFGFSDKNVGDAPADRHEAVSYQRRSAGGAALGSVVRLNSIHEHADRGSIAAAGSWVYATWATIKSYNHYQGTDPRLLRFRSNGSNGSGAWHAIQNLTTSGRVENPSIAASGTYVYIAYVDADTGDVILVTNANHGDGGWSAHVIGSTTVSNSSGSYGYASIAAAGSNVGVTWIRASGTIKAWVSTDHGANEAASQDIAGGAAPETDQPRTAALGDRIAFAVTTTAGTRVVVWKAAGFGPKRTAGQFGSAMTYKSGYAPAIALTGTSGVAVAWAGCRYSDCGGSNSPPKGVDLLYRESVDNGLHWKALKVLGSSTASGATGNARRFNEYATIVFAAGKRYVQYVAVSINTVTSSFLLRIGSGHP